MKKNILILIIIAVVLIVSLVWYFSSYSNMPEATKQTNNSQSTSNTISISNFAFNPATLTIKQGEEVIWINKDSASHTVTSVSGTELDSGKMNSGQTYSHVFSTKGTFDYYCTFHTMMKGKIIVE